MTTKKCSKCGEEKPATLEYFNKITHRSGNTGLRAICKECERESSKEYYNENREEIIRNGREYRKQHPDRIRVSKRKYRKKNKDKINADFMQYYAKNKDKFWKYSHTPSAIECNRKNARRYREENLEEISKRKQADTDNLTDVYICCVIRQLTGMSAKKIKQHPELIEQYRQYLFNYRKLKQLNNGKFRQEDNRI